MEHVTIVGAEDDLLVLATGSGERFALPIDEVLRAELRRAKAGREEKAPPLAASPREIQAHSRAGLSATEVAELLGVSREIVERFEGPVLAEREHVADRAQKASVRRTPGDGQAGAAPSRVLGDAVAAHLHSRGTRPDAVTWDAYRHDTGRWFLTGTFETDERGGIARFTYDAPGNYVLSDNDDARWLIGLALPAAEPARDDLQQVRERRLTAVQDESAAADELPLGSITGVDIDALPLGDSFDQALDLATPERTTPSRTTRDGALPDEPIRATAEEPAAAAASAPDGGREGDHDGARHRVAFGPWPTSSPVPPGSSGASSSPS